MPLYPTRRTAATSIVALEVSPVGKRSVEGVEKLQSYKSPAEAQLQAFR